MVNVMCSWTGCKYNNDRVGGSYGECVNTEVVTLKYDHFDNDAVLRCQQYDEKDSN